MGSCSSSAAPQQPGGGAQRPVSAPARQVRREDPLKGLPTRAPPRVQPKPPPEQQSAWLSAAPLAEICARGKSTIVLDGEETLVSGAVRHACEKARELFDDIRGRQHESAGTRRGRRLWRGILGWITKQGFKTPKDGPPGYRVFLFRNVLQTIEFHEELQLTSEPPESTRSGSVDSCAGWGGLEDSADAPTVEELQDVVRGLMRKEAGVRAPALPSPDMAVRIIETLTELYCGVPNVVEVEVPRDGKLVVVGDTHGQFADIMHIFDTEQMPSPSNIFLFNGDYVDRGLQGLEIVLMLYCLKLLYPSSVHLNRGNHEEERVNSYSRTSKEGDRMQKFQWQIEHAYPTLAGHKGPGSFFHTCQQSFMALPLLHLLCKEGRRKIVVVHGGLPDVGSPVTLAEINALDRKVPCPKSKTGPVVVHPDGSTHRTKTPPERRGDRIIQALLWSDPKTLPDGVRSEPSEHRGAGVLFSAAVSAEFLDTNGIDQHIIRSHETAHKGHVVNHQIGDRLLCQTIFSASNYMSNTNMGAYIVVSAGDSGSGDVTLTPTSYYVRQDGNVFVDRYAQGSDAVFAGKEEWTHREAEALTKTATDFLGQFIFSHRTRLLKEFQARDHKKTGRCSKRAWVEVMRVVVSRRMPWWGLCRYLCRQDVTGGIAYVPFVERFQNKLARAWMVAWCCDMMLHMSARVSRVARGVRDQLAATSHSSPTGRRLSRDERAKLSYNEVCAAIGRSLPGMSQLAIYYLQTCVLDENSDGYLDMAEWDRQMSVEKDGAIPGVLDLWDVIQKHGDGEKGPYAIFLRRFPAEGMTAEQFVEEAMMLCEHTTTEARDDWVVSAKSLKDESGRVHADVVRSRVAAFGSNFLMAEKMMEVIDAISRARVELRYLFKMLDTDGSGKLSRGEFERGLEQLELRADGYGDPLPASDHWIDTLWNEADADGSGQIDIDEFLSTVAVIDTWAAEHSSDLSERKSSIVRRQSMRRCS
eukprot:TRINITY_DN7859_c2_g1_i1.p1 TRINITY_DN7859_c2_g1~~TRINITY_DN7859_c2_g1_i1.p1  ORF type:complete len:978 (+),score=246.44 TRINITY_DN7859_c2_g1_i1:36-2969(+)